MNQGKKASKKSLNETEPKKTKGNKSQNAKPKSLKSKPGPNKVSPNKAPENVKPLKPKPPMPKPKIAKPAHTRRKMKIKEIIEDMRRQRPTQNNFEDLYKLEGFELYRDEYRKRAGL